MSGWLSGPRDSRSLGHSAIDGGGDPFSGARVVSVAHFEPAVGMRGEALDSYKRRFGTLFVDESTRRRGGIGSVVRATNVLGEQFALKTLVIPERDERASEAEYERYEAGLKTAFRQEFECHKAVSGLKGFPHLYGMGEVAGTPAIVMEWVCGETLVHVCDALAVDGAGRMPTLVAAQIGRDVFDLLAHLDFLEGGFVHRDISLANVMVRTSRLSLAEQVEEGFFDVCLIDRVVDAGGDAGLVVYEGQFSYSQGDGRFCAARDAYGGYRGNRCAAQIAQNRCVCDGERDIPARLRACAV